MITTTTPQTTARQRLVRQTERVLRQLAPLDLADVPLYLLHAPDAPPHFSTEHASGYTSRNLDLSAAGWLREQGRWQGRGPCIWVNENMRCLLGVSIHELAHVFDAGINTAPTSDEVETKAVERVAALSQLCDLGLPSSAKPWAMHDANWIRLVVHLESRATAAGYVVPWPNIASLGWYELSNYGFYRRALGDEPERMAGASFAEIKATTAPPELRHLWQRDLLFWEKQTTRMRDRMSAQLAIGIDSDMELFGANEQ